MPAHSNCRFRNVSYHPRWAPEVRRKCTGNWPTLSTHLLPITAPLSGTAVHAVSGKSSWWRSWFWIPVLMMASLPCESWGATYKVAVVGPWTCDPLFSKALPDEAARLAISRINKDPYLKKGYWYDYTLVNEDCQTSRALVHFADLEGYGSAFLGPANPGFCYSAALLGKHWNKAVLSWSCLQPKMDRSMYPTFLRPTPLTSRVLFSILRFFRWARVGIVTSRDDLWVATGHELAASLRALGLPVHTVATMGKDGDTDGAQKALLQIKEASGVRVVILCMHSVLIGGEAQHELLTTAVDMQMVDRGYVFIPYDTLLYSLPYKNAEYPLLANSTKLRQAYDAVLTVTLDSGEKNFHEAFQEAQDSYDIRSRVPPEEVSPFFGTIYNMIYFLAMSVEQSRLAEGRWVSGEVLARSEGGFQFLGFNQLLSAGRNGTGMQGRYVVLDTDGRGAALRPTHILEAAHTTAEFGGLRYLGRSIHFAGAAPSTDSSCWFSSLLPCGAGMDSITLFLIFLLLFLLVGGAAVLATILRLRMGIGIGFGWDGPGNKVVLTLEDLVFINTQLSRRRLNDDNITKAIVAGKTPFHSVSGRSYAASNPETSNVAIYEGDWVWLKKFPNADSIQEVKEDTETAFIKLRDMRQENLNLFLGLFFDSGVFSLVTEYCCRGSLEDLLSNEDVRLDWMFKASLMMDLIRGMKFLHSRKVIHGKLKSRNCVVDGRFVLKVTDYGFDSLLNSQGIRLEEEKAEDLLWTAPEHLRKTADMRGSYAGDVYSFSIIVQEVISRGAPFCTLDLPAAEIIQKVRSPPPLCRPTVSTTQAHIECVQIMKQCWSEDPEQRPTFQEIFRQFNRMNRGKKTNLIDSMLRMLEQYSSNLEDLIRERTEELEVERQKTDRLVAQMLPKSVAQALKTGKPVQPEYFSEVTLYFSDIVGFTTISALSEPIEVVDLLNDLYTLFDAIIGQHDVYKVETIGDAYMVSSGVPNRNGSRHAAEVSNMSLDILHCIGAFKMRHMPDVKVKIRIGLHTGPVVAGVVGLTMPRYCLFGDTVNTASRMESTGLPYRIHVNQNTVDVLHSLKMGYKLDTRGLTELKGKGVENTYWLVGRDGFDKPLPVPPDLTPGASNHGISLDEIPPDRRQKFIDRQKMMK